MSATALLTITVVRKKEKKVFDLELESELAEDFVKKMRKLIMIK